MNIHIICNLLQLQWGFFLNTSIIISERYSRLLVNLTFLMQNSYTICFSFFIIIIIIIVIQRGNSGIYNITKLTRMQWKLVLRI